MKKLMNYIIFMMIPILGISQSWDVDNNPGRFRLINGETYEEYKKTFLLETESSGKVNFDDGKNWSGYHYPYRRNSLYEMEGMNVIDKLNCIGEIELVEYLTILQDSLIRVNDGLPWGGNCHGYSLASSYFVEPQSVTIDSIEFTSPEIKSLLIYFADEHGGSVDVIGTRCKNDQQMSYVDRINRDVMISRGEYIDPCDGMNPASFHVSLKRMVGRHRESFTVDLDDSNHVWNHPIVGYRCRISDYHNNNIYHIITEIDYLGYQHPYDDTNILGEGEQLIKTEIYEYTLNVDSSGKIIGGEWVGDNYPDFIWKYNKTLPDFIDKWKILKRLNIKF